ncbi:MAG: bifunctional adenosylcobinamide kinase/adenosylcobinamide-phosphate guanylyltransferase [Clostridia bacterium]|nr:bifunctional adenosylcobinamide kinase/adenosylcobinamide-phosphate guanylyltransferase [Clostridia bacterium]
MILVFGGAYQGKLDYVLEKYNLNKDDVERCNVGKASLGFDKKVIYGLDKFVYACVKEGVEAKEVLVENLDKLQDKIIICDDISQGIVPLDKDEREWREATGRAMVALGKMADDVYRVFCGLATKIK